MTRIVLKNQDRDIHIVLPDGHVVELQYRKEGPSLDILFDEPQHVHNWNNETESMSPAPTINNKKYIHKADQLMIPLVLEDK